MDLPPIARYILGGVMAVMLTVGFGLSVQVRCATFLSVPTVVSKVGRAYVITFAVAYLLTGKYSGTTRGGTGERSEVTCASRSEVMCACVIV